MVLDYYVMKEEVFNQLVTLWKYADGRKPSRDFLDCIQHKAYREMYDISN